MRPSVSAVLITQNEEHYIERCLRSVQWADEIVVIDAFSQDRTPEICQNPKAPWHSKLKFYSRPWEGFRAQRMHALKEASHPWVLVIDSDEECSTELAEAIRALLSKPVEYSAYKVRRIEYFLGRPIHYGIWNPSYQDRFFLKDGVEYLNEVHEYPKFLTPPGRIHAPLHHAPDFGVEKFLAKMNRYTSIEAKDRYSQGQRTHLGKLLGAFPAMFLKNYFYYQSYKDGFHGLIISLLEGLSRVSRHVKLWQLDQKQKRHHES